MWASLIILTALIVVGALLYAHHIYTGRREADREADAPTDTAATGTPEDEEEECCGMHITCEKDSLLAGISKSIEYYEDEELDAYKGREADGYSEEETEQFRDVLLTLLPEDIAGWARSLQLRGITLPADVREELLMIVAERRESKQN